MMERCNITRAGGDRFLTVTVKLPPGLPDNHVAVTVAGYTLLAGRRTANELLAEGELDWQARKRGKGRTD